MHTLGKLQHVARTRGCNPFKKTCLPRGDPSDTPRDPILPPALLCFPPSALPRWESPFPSPLPCRASLCLQWKQQQQEASQLTAPALQPEHEEEEKQGQRLEWLWRSRRTWLLNCSRMWIRSSWAWFGTESLPCLLALQSCIGPTCLQLLVRFIYRPPFLFCPCMIRKCRKLNYLQQMEFGRENASLHPMENEVSSSVIFCSAPVDHAWVANWCALADSGAFSALLHLSFWVPRGRKELSSEF